MTAKEVLRQHAPGFDFGDNENLICVLDAMEEYAALKSRTVTDGKTNCGIAAIFILSQLREYKKYDDKVSFLDSFLRDLLKGGEGK